MTGTVGVIARAMRHGFGWLGRNSRTLHRVAWLTILAMTLKTCSGYGSDAGEWTFRYPPEGFVISAILVVLVLACIGSIVRLATRRPPAVPVALILSGFFLFVSYPPRSPLRDGALSHVCGARVGCFFLTTAFVPTDTVYNLWQASERESWTWWKSGASDALSYSEDGSYVSDPRLILSRGERYLVVARGGYLVDAIELSTGQSVSEVVFWNDADRDARMQRNSDAIQSLLDGDA